MALGTVGLFVFAMANPVDFATRMQGLDYVPDPLWWLLGAIVSFYFGARELHYAREKRPQMLISSRPIADNDTVRPTNLPAPLPFFPTMQH